MPAGPPALVDRRPSVTSSRLVAELAPPPRFDAVRFATYHPDPAEPSQAAALTAVTDFARRLEAPQRRRSLFRRATATSSTSRPGIYLDGGFGVGKTHLLASLWHQSPAPKAFGTFVEFTNLSGALGFQSTVDALSASRLVCIDEFELDDPGDTVLLSTLLGRLVDSGVRIAATSNTLPDRLGEGRFAAQDFLREIQALSAHFEVLRVEGADYRHRGLPAAPSPHDENDLAVLAARTHRATLDDWPALLEHLAAVHPSRYGALLDGVDTVVLRGVAPVADQHVALRLVVFADRLYDRDVPVIASGVAFDQLFGPDLLGGGYRKKYLRAVTRLIALAREGEGIDRRELRR